MIRMGEPEDLAAEVERLRNDPEDRRECLEIASLMEECGPEATFFRLAEAAGAAGLIDHDALLRRTPVDADFGRALTELRTVLVGQLRDVLEELDLMVVPVGERNLDPGTGTTSESGLG